MLAQSLEVRVQLTSQSNKMKNHSTLKLSIPAPCSQNWNEMTPTERGRFCASCNKHVIDFTHFTDKQLLDFFAKNTGNVCGRLGADQMERELILQEHAKRGYMIPKLFVGAALAAALAGQAKAQTSAARAKNVTEVIKPQPVQKKTSVPVTENSNYIVGKVADSSGTGIPFANVMVMEMNDGVMADMDGNFKMDIPGQFKDSTITLVFSSIGYSVKEMEVLITGLPVRAEIILDPGVLLPEIKVEAFANPVVERTFYLGGAIAVTQVTQCRNVDAEAVRSFDEDIWQRIFGWQKPPPGATRNF